MAPAGGDRREVLALSGEPASGFGILEFKDNDFIRSVVAAMPDVPHAYIRVGELTHPSLPPFRLMVDRISFCDPYLRHLVRYWSLSGAYVLNDPFFTLVFDKLSECSVYDALSISHPRTILLPSGNRSDDVSEMVVEPAWGDIESAVGFPCILKPVDGYAWQEVFKVPDPATLRGLYESLKDRRTLMVQKLVEYTSYYRAFCMNARDVLIVRWTPQPFDRGEYALPAPGEMGAVEGHIIQKTIELNAALGLDFNAVEWCLAKDGTPVIIDSYNDVPDVRREKLPPAAYDWIVERFCGCIREKLRDGARNRIVRVVPAGSDPGPQSS